MMKQLWIVLLAVAALSLMVASVRAETKYVNDIMKITFRTGPGIGHKVLDEVPSGEQVEVLRTQNTWSEVQLPDNRTGWVLTRFLTQDRPKTLQLRQAKEKAADLTARLADLSAENDKLSAENKALKSEVEKMRSELASVRQSYEDLKSNSGNYLKIKNAYDAAEQARVQQGRRLDRVENQLRERNIYLFLSGAVVMIIGFIIGRSGRNSRRRSPYL